MNTEIMSQWLRAFYIHVGTERKILLTIDNFSAHKSAVKDCPLPSVLGVRYQLPRYYLDTYLPRPSRYLPDLIALIQVST